MSPDDLPRIAHDAATFEAFYRANVEAIQRFVARRVDDPHLAADLAADVFLAAVGAAGPATVAAPVPRAVRIRRRRLALSGAGLATAVAAAVAVALTTSGGVAASAYAVQSRANGTVSVSIRDLRDAAGLERKLRAAGIPAIVDDVADPKRCAGGGTPAGATPPGAAQGGVVRSQRAGADDGPATATAGSGPGRSTRASGGPPARRS